MSETVIEVRELSKGYRTYSKLSDVLKEGLLGGIRHDVFWALRDVSFDVAEGERIGIIGANGAGKSTLLKIITGNIAPTSGSVAVNGRISALLNLVPSLRKNETGLENIKLNLLMSGARRSEMPRLIEEIIDFTELSSFIYQPVRTYSSGMQARLAFAVATSVTPEILIIDEVLGTGDAYFQGKAQQRMEALCAQGKALLFVSHATGSVLNLCNRALWLENGSIRMDSWPERVIKSYIEDSKRVEDLGARPDNRSAVEAGESVSGNKGIDLFDEGTTTLRIVGENDTFRSTHYITNIELMFGRYGAASVPLDFIDEMDLAPCGKLEVLGTEWGRLHTRHGVECRTLSSRTGRNRGGYITVRLPACGKDDESEFGLSFDSDTERGIESLKLEIFDPISGTWNLVPEKERCETIGGWTRYGFGVKWARHRAHDLSVARDTYAASALPSAEISSVRMFAEGDSVTMIGEGQPFEIVAQVSVRRPVPKMDVCIEINRSDGVYVFWQSSGMTGHNFENQCDHFAVAFVFDRNFLGLGKYDVSVQIGNGWDLEANFPHSQIIDRSVNALRFEVLRAHPLLDRGVAVETVRVEMREAAG